MNKKLMVFKNGDEFVVVDEMNHQYYEMATLQDALRKIKELLEEPKENAKTEEDYSWGVGV